MPHKRSKAGKAVKRMRRHEKSRVRASGEDQCGPSLNGYASSLSEDKEFAAGEVHGTVRVVQECGQQQKV
jgi:hypothetical protein